MEFVALAQGVAGIWQRRLDAAAVAFIWVLGLGIVLMLALVIGYYIVDESRRSRKDGLKIRILDAVARAGEAKTPEQAKEITISGGGEVFERGGLAVIAQVYESLNAQGRAVLGDMLTRMDAPQRLAKQLNSTNEDFLVEIIRLAGDLKLTALAGQIAELLYAHRDNIELQYQAFMALSKLGARDYILKICLDKSFSQTLSFRSLQHVVQAYAGDKAELYARLFASPDDYIVRICVKRVGVEHITELAADVVPYLASDNFNLVIDAARSLGMLGYGPAAEKIAPLLIDRHWEVRSIAVTALGGIDRDGYEADLIRALQDREWQVRYNAAAVLKDSPNIEGIRQAVVATGDRYALEMLEFMTQANELWRQAE